MAARLPPGHALSTDRLIQDHTLYLYVVSFSPVVAEAVRAYMVGR